MEKWQASSALSYGGNVIVLGNNSDEVWMYTALKTISRAGDDDEIRRIDERIEASSGAADLVPGCSFLRCLNPEELEQRPRTLPYLGTDILHQELKFDLSKVELRSQPASGPPFSSRATLLLEIKDSITQSTRKDQKDGAMASK